MSSKPWFRLLVLVIVFVGLAALLKMGNRISGDGSAPRDSILQLELDGVILNGKKFLASLKRYEKEPNIKALVISIDSPGGAVGPSQEINAAIARWKEKTKTPVVCSSSGLMASGAYYSAVACDRIVVSAGALVGSIGVIMEFANLEKLYDWAKVTRYSITSGRFKDSGAEYRAMREDERGLFQDLINEVYGQFKEAVSKGRPALKKETLDEYADGRVFTGNKAVELGFADQVGGLDDAIAVARDLAKLPADTEIFKPAKPKRSIWDWQEIDDPLNSVTEAAKKAMRLELLNRPLYLMPGSWGEEN